MRPVLPGESHVCDAHGVQLLKVGGPGAPPRFFEHIPKLLKSYGPKGSQQRCLISKMPVRGGTRHAESGADLAQCQSANTFSRNKFKAGFHDGFAQVAVVVIL